VHNLSYESDFDFHVNDDSFSYERLRSNTTLKKRYNLEMAYIVWLLNYQIQVSAVDLYGALSERCRVGLHFSVLFK